MNKTGYDVIVGCEYSGRVRNALRENGINAMSVDLLPSEDNSKHHYQGDIAPYLSMPWRMAIFHPSCQYLANSGVRWRVERQEWQQVREAAEFFLACYNANAPLVAVENPVQHKYAREAIGGMRPSFSVQPWEFGDPAKKRTCFWTRGLPPLVPTSDMTAADARADCHLAPPSPDRWKERARTYPGIAEAIADQWGAVLKKELAA